MSGQMSNFLEISNLSTLQVHISKTICRMETKSSPTSSTFNFQKNNVLFRYRDKIFVSHVYHPGRDNATLAGKVDNGQSECKSLIDIWNGEEAYETGLCEKKYLVSGP